MSISISAKCYAERSSSPQSRIDEGDNKTMNHEIEFYSRGMLMYS